jgi:hypothetical protein
MLSEKGQQLVGVIPPRRPLERGKAVGAIVVRVLVRAHPEDGICPGELDGPACWQVAHHKRRPAAAHLVAQIDVDA